MTSVTLSHVHETREAVAAVEFTPPHPPRTETPEYARAHKFLVYTKNAPCKVCGVTRRTLRYPKANPFGATALETHHVHVERSLAYACDWRKVHLDFPSVYDQESFLHWVDSPENLVVLCNVHHRSVEHGIHHLLPADFNVQRYLRDGYIVAASAQDAAKVEAQDEALLQQLGVEQAVDTALVASTAKPKKPRMRRKTTPVTTTSVASPTTSPIVA